MATNQEREMRWIGAWSDLEEIVAGGWGMRCALPDGTVTDVDECKAWLQESAYDDWHVEVKAGWVLGKPGVIATRWREERDPPT